MVTADHGRLNVSPTSTETAIDDLVQPSTVVGPLAAGYEERYGYLEAQRSLELTNVDPDLPTSAKAALALYRSVKAQELDGVIAIDPIALAYLLNASGPVEVNDSMRAGTAIPARVTGDQVAQLLYVDVYDTFGGRSEAREAFLTAFATRSLQTLLAGDWDLARLRRGLDQSTGGRHIQIYSAHASEEAAFEELGVAGTLPDGPGDWLTVTVNNAGANKQDVHVKHTFEAELSLRRQDEAGSCASNDTSPAAVVVDGTISARIDNPLGKRGHDIYILGSTGPDGRIGSGPPGLNQSWVSLWLPGDAKVEAGYDLVGGQIDVSLGAMHGRTVVDRYVDTPPHDHGGFSVKTCYPTTLERDGDAYVYRLTWWRQSKAIPDRLAVSIGPPAGMTVTDVQVTGGGRSGPAPGQRIQPLKAEVRSFGAQVIGQITADATIEVRMVPDGQVPAVAQAGD